MADVTRDGHWKHEWVPLDYTAAKEKGHGRVPKGWQGGGKTVKPPDAAPVRHGWEPGPNDTHIQVEQVGTGGTSMGAFHRASNAAHLHRIPDQYGTGHEWEVRSHETHEVLGHVRPSSTPGHWVGESMYEPTGETNREYHGPDFMKAVHGVLGHPAYGYSWYRVKREGPTAPRPRARRATWASVWAARWDMTRRG
jgi:hypothetical protein